MDSGLRRGRESVLRQEKSMSADDFRNLKSKLQAAGSSSLRHGVEGGDSGCW